MCKSLTGMFNRRTVSLSAGSPSLGVTVVIVLHVIFAKAGPIEGDMGGGQFHGRA